MNLKSNKSENSFIKFNILKQNFKQRSTFNICTLINHKYLENTI